MKQIFILYAIVFCSIAAMAQQQAGKAYGSQFSVKAGYNIARVTGSAPDFKPSSKNGFMVAASFAPASRNGFGFKTELVFSRQGFGFNAGGKTNTIQSDYIYLPQFTTFTIAKKVQLQLGGQVGYLLRSNETKPAEEKTGITEAMNRLDYGAAGGIEIFPFKGIIIGGRYNMSLGNSFKVPAAGSVINPLPFNPSDVKSRNAVINFYLGYRF
ncbi:MAG: PorT family protein [Chitinophagaceae bacterium]|nr:MAG: PorT family protein [Chitinophagaceae bacterium]